MVIFSRFEQHERMLAERERERREQQRLVSLGQRSSSRGELRPKSVTETESDRDLPSYMRSTSASVKKEKPAEKGGGPVERIRRRSSQHHHQSQSQGDLRRISGVQDQDTSSEEDMEARWKQRSASQDRRHGAERPGPGRAKSERDLSRVARVNLGSRDNVSQASRGDTPTQVRGQRMKMKTTTIISGDGAVVVKPPETQPQYAVRGTEAVDVTRAPLSRQLAEVCRNLKTGSQSQGYLKRMSELMFLSQTSAVSLFSVTAVFIISHSLAMRGKDAGGCR